ncbi:hypothetical protein D3C77_34630 [compost metagenome]
MNCYHWNVCKALYATTPLTTQEIVDCSASHLFRRKPFRPRGLAASSFYLAALSGTRKCRPSKLKELKKLQRYVVRSRLGN